MTPMGVETRAMSSPFGRCQRASSRPTGSGRAAMASRPLAMASMRASSSRRRSRSAGVRLCAAFKSSALAARMSLAFARIAFAAASNALSFVARSVWRRAFDAARASSPQCASSWSESRRSAAILAALSFFRCGLEARAPTSSLILPRSFRREPDRRDGSSRRGHDSRELFLFPNSCARRCAAHRTPHRR